MEAKLDDVFAQRLDGVFEEDFPFFEDDVELGLQLVGDHAGGHRAKHLPVLAGLDGDDGDEVGDALGQFGHGAEFVGFACAAAFLEGFDALLVGAGERDGQALGNEVVAGVAGGDFDLVGFSAKTHDILNEDDFSFCHKLLRGCGPPTQRAARNCGG